MNARPTTNGEPQTTNELRRPFFTRVLLSDYLVLYLCLLYGAFMLPFVEGFASPSNLANILASMLPLLIVAIGQTLVLVSGGIDLSVTSVIALSSVTGAFVMNADNGWLSGNPIAVPTAILLMLLVGALLGLLNGAAITRFQMPPFIVTLTSMMFFSGFAIWLTESKTIYNLPASFNAIGGSTWHNLPVWALSLAVVLAAGAHLLLDRTLFGRWLYAVGQNPRTSFISGVPVNRVLLSTYVLCGLCAAVASILYTGRLETASPVQGQRILLDVIGATVIGGTSLFGGKGKIIWTVCGVLFLTLIHNSLDLLSMSDFAIMMVKGGVILLAAWVDAVRNRMGKV